MGKLLNKNRIKNGTWSILQSYKLADLNKAISNYGNVTQQNAKTALLKQKNRVTKKQLIKILRPNLTAPTPTPRTPKNKYSRYSYRGDPASLYKLPGGSIHNRVEINRFKRRAELSLKGSLLSINEKKQQVNTAVKKYTLELQKMTRKGNTLLANLSPPKEIPSTRNANKIEQSLLQNYKTKNAGKAWMKKAGIKRRKPQKTQHVNKPISRVLSPSTRSWLDGIFDRNKTVTTHAKSIPHRVIPTKSPNKSPNNNKTPSPNFTNLLKTPNNQKAIGNNNAVKGYNENANQTNNIGYKNNNNTQSSVQRLLARTKVVRVNNVK